MDSASAKELFVLGRVSARPTHGHEIMRTLRVSNADLWVELSEKHVYYVLRKLERDGLVEASEQREGHLPARKVYRITPLGREALADMLQAQSLVRAMPYSDFDVVFGMLGYTDVLGDAEKSEVLHRRRDFLREIIERVGEARAATEGNADAGAVQHMVLDKTQGLATAELEWLEGVMVRVDRDGWESIKPVVGPEEDKTGAKS
jgi:DNA-binding PadR family transcriptional regulator